jgi:DNA-binding transcriptional LysR family regulator
MDRIEQLRIFVSVAKLNNFSEAAKQLSLPRSSVTHAIQQLEAYYAVRLFHRTTRRVTLTQDGINLLPLSQNLLFDFDHLEQQAQRSTREYRGTLRVDMPNRIAHHIVLPALPDFFAQYPEICIQLNSSDQFTNLVEQSIDCVIRVGTLTNSSLIARQLGNLHMVNCASPAYIARCGQPTQIEQLSQHRMINYSGAVGQQQAVFQDGERNIMLDCSVSVNNTEAYIMAAKAGLGIIQVPLYDVLDEIEHGSLVSILSEHTAPAMPIHLLYPNRQYQPSRLTTFLFWLEQLLKVTASRTASTQ